MSLSDLDYMKLARDLAQRGRGQTSPNPIVGALLVKGAKIIAEGWHAYLGGDHAEIMAIKKAGPKAKGAKLYVTLEPCAHFGRTPPCVDKIIESGITEVIIGMKDPNPLNSGQTFQKLKDARIKVKVGFLEDELLRMNEAFMKYITKRVPFVVAKCAQTLDGKIAAQNGQSQWITSQSSRDLAHLLRRDFDGIVVGINTVLKDNPFLNAVGRRRPIKKIILDAKLKTPVNANVFKETADGDVIVVTGRKASKPKIKALERKGARVLEAPMIKNNLDWPWLLEELTKQEIASLLIEGGGQTTGRALKAGCVDKLLIFVAPKIMGDENAIDAISGFKINHIDETVKLDNLTVQKINEDILIEGYVHRDH